MRLIMRLYAFLFVFILAAAPGLARADTIRILALGDSLTAGYGLAPGEGFPARLEAALTARGHDVTVIDAGVSGDTASAGQARLEWSLGEGADAAIVELGGNDALRGLPPESTRKALGRIIEALRARDIPVLLAGMQAPPNLGPRYGEAFNAIFPALAKQHDILLYPFFLDGVAAEPDPSVEALIDLAQSR